MKICLIHNLWGKEARGGAESVLTLIIQQLRTNGHQVIIITTQAQSKKITSEIVNGIQVYALPSKYAKLTNVPHWRRLFFHIISNFNLISYFEVKKIIQSENPEVVWTHNVVGIGSIIFCLFHKKNIRHIHTLHDIQLLHPSGLLLRGQEKLIDSFIAFLYQEIQKIYIPSFSEIISPSKWLLNIHKKKGFFKKNIYQVLPNPFSYNGNADVVKSQDTKEIFTFLYVGQIEQHKGVRILIESFKKITNQQLRLVIVGDGSQLQNIRDQNSDKRIECIGRHTSSSVREIMRTADCVIVPSLCYENFPTVIIEAIHARVPVLASGFGGITELISNNQFLFEPTKENITEKLTWAFEHRNQLQNLFFTSSNVFNNISVVEYCQKLKL